MDENIIRPQGGRAGKGEKICPFLHKYQARRFLVEETFKSSKTYEGLEHLKGVIKAIFLACAFLILHLHTQPHELREEV
ncbi:MAG: hypothetical protein ABIM88_05930 [candidate division WOR-3 bacterium]